MLKLLKENWLWIVLPFVIVIGGLIFIAMMNDSPGQEFIYDLG